MVARAGCQCSLLLATVPHRRTPIILQDPLVSISPECFSILYLNSILALLPCSLPKLSPVIDLFAVLTGPHSFYGTLSSPSLLAEILDLNEKPTLRPAYITDYETMLWCQYPTLLDARGEVVEGVVYHVQSMEDGEKLAAYETDNYRAEPCLIRYTDGQSRGGLLVIIPSLRRIWMI